MLIRAWNAARGELQWNDNSPMKSGAARMSGGLGVVMVGCHLGRHRRRGLMMPDLHEKHGRERQLCPRHCGQEQGRRDELLRHALSASQEKLLRYVTGITGKRDQAPPKDLAQQVLEGPA